jgi:hypothetical protein
MIKIKPLTYRDLCYSFGDPDIPGGLEKIRASQELVHLPFPLICNEKLIDTIKCHSYCAAAYRDALEEILEKFGQDGIDHYGLNTFHGCHVERKTKDKKWWSIHTWGMAFDHNIAFGPWGGPTAMPYYFVQAFLKRGFGWGGRFRDGMHFSVTGT